MIRFGFFEYGAPEVFQPITAPTPTPKADQVQLKVLGFGLNPYDASWRRGEQAAFRKAKFPVVPGTDVVGRITALGEDVEGFAVGDIVMNYRPQGGYSEYVTASAAKIVKKPEAISLLTAAALPQVGIAAYTVLQQLALTAGQTLVIEGASGGVGALLVQLAKAQKLNVIATASKANADYLSQLGADKIGAYDEANLGKVCAGQADAVVNAVFGGRDHGFGASMLKPGGKLLTTAYTDVKPALPEGAKALQLTKMAPTKEALTAVSNLAEENGLILKIAEALPFDVKGVIEGHQLLESHHAAGKLVVMQSQPGID